MEQVDFGLTQEELTVLAESADTARVSCEGGSEGDLG